MFLYICSWVAATTMHTSEKDQFGACIVAIGEEVKREVVGGWFSLDETINMRNSPHCTVFRAARSGSFSSNITFPSFVVKSLTCSGSVSEFSASQYAITHEQSQLITFVWPKMSSPFYPNLRVSLHLAPTRKAMARTPSLSLLYVELQHIQSARRHAGDKKQH